MVPARICPGGLPQLLCARRGQLTVMQDPAKSQYQDRAGKRQLTLHLFCSGATGYGDSWDLASNEVVAWGAHRTNFNLVCDFNSEDAAAAKEGKRGQGRARGRAELMSHLVWGHRHCHSWWELNICAVPTAAALWGAESRGYFSGGGKRGMNQN